MTTPAGLAPLGMSADQERLYRRLVVLGSAPVEELAPWAGLEPAEVDGHLRSLEGQGLVAHVPSAEEPATWHWVAAPPGVALRALVNERRHELEQASLAAARLASEFRALVAEADARNLVEVVTGAAGVGQRFLQLQLGAAREVCALVTERPIAVSGAENDAEETATARGVAYRVVLEAAVLEQPGAMAALAAVLRRDEQIRVAATVPTKLVMADGEVAMVPLSAGDTEPAAVIVRGSGLLGALAALFEASWRTAVPLRVSGEDEVATVATGPTPLDLQVLSLLLAGLTDRAIASQLNLGLRTVQRRVSALLDLAGVSTRIQLGWAAYERGWVTRT